MGVNPYNDVRWHAVRLAAKRRDGWKCTECGAHGQLEVHHKIRARQEPGKAYELGNCVTLCRSCHVKATLAERGHLPNPARDAWKTLLKQGLENASVSRNPATPV